MKNVFESSETGRPHGQEIPAEQLSFDKLIQQFEEGREQSTDSCLPELRSVDVKYITQNAEYLSQVGGDSGFIGKEEYTEFRNKLWQDLYSGCIENSEFDEKLMALGVVRRGLEARSTVNIAALFAAAGLE